VGAYKAEFKHDFPNPEIIQSSLPSDLSEEKVKTAFLAEFRLDI
jgi:hypothetical protein